MGITRRDFLDGVAMAIGAGLAPGRAIAGQIADAGYPPALTGWRGSTPMAHQIAHAVRDGAKLSVDSQPVEETVDLVIVGSGISGLAAAHFYRAAHPKARILILENHDEFGGHARRNEFNVDGRTLIGYGGSESIQSPATEWSKPARKLLTDVGIDIARFEKAFDRNLYPGLGLSRGVFFKRETFGVDRLVTGDPTRMVADDIPPKRMNARSAAAFAADFPLPDADREAIVALYTQKRDVLPDLSAEQQAQYLGTLSYRDFVIRHWGLPDLAARTFQGRSNDYFAAGVDGVPAYDAMNAGYPGFQGLKLRIDPEVLAAFDEPYIHHFPDGNASIARALVRKLIPGVAPGRTMDDLVTARFDYSKLDQAGKPVRLRLLSTVVSVRNRSDDKVDVGYINPNGFHRVQAAHVIYAGYGMMLPYLCPDIGETQRAALAAGVKAPMAYVNVAVRNWRPWVKLGVHEVTNPMGFFSRMKLDYPVSLGGYRFAKGPDEPILLHLVHVPTVYFSGLDQRNAWRAARAMLYAMTFEEFERQVRDELSRMLGPGGFDADKDIAAITVNRWGHGYAYGFNSIYDKQVDPPLDAVGRARVGRISIAGSDAAWSAYAHSAIDEARRAVDESA